MSAKDLTIDLADGKFENKIVNLANGDGNTEITIKGDILGQVQWKTVGDDIVITAYGTQEGYWQKTEYSVTKMESGKNKGKYEIITKKYVYDSEKDSLSKLISTTTTYAKKTSHFDNQAELQQIGKDGKVYYSQTMPFEINESATTIASSKVLGTVRIKGANNLAQTDSLKLKTDIFKIYEGVKPEDTFDARIDLINSNYYILNPKKGKYVGSWTNDMTGSNTANETYDLKTGKDYIVFTGDSGKDTVLLQEKSDINLFAQNKVFTFKRSKNDAVATINEHIGKNYTYRANCKVSLTAEADGENKGKYKADINYYPLNSGYYNVDDESETMYLTADELKKYGLGKGTTTDLYIKAKNDWSEFTTNISKIYSKNGTVVLKDYFKIGADNVSIVAGFDPETDLPVTKSIIPYLEDGKINVLGNVYAKKNQKLTGTFLDEVFTGGKENDTISTGKGDDVIYSSFGKDSILINGNGDKDFIKTAQVRENTTISFDKDINFDTTKLNIYGAFVANEDNEVFVPMFVKSGNDLAIDSNLVYESVKRQGLVYGYPKIADNKITIKDFFINEKIKGAVTFDNKSFDEKLQDTFIKSIIQIGKINKKNTINDINSYNNFILGGVKKDTIIISHSGNDNIETFKGNDEIRFTETATGKKTVISSIIDGKDTITFEDGIGSGLELNIGSEVMQYSDIPSTISFEKTGSDLIYKTEIKKYKEDFRKIKKDVTNTVAIKNYFDNEYNVKFITKFDEENVVKDLANALGDNYLKINGVYEKSLKTTFHDGTDFKDEYSYNGKGKAMMTDNGNNDKYNLKLTSKSNLYVCDKLGNDEFIFQTNKDNMRLYFDVSLPASEEEMPATGNELFVFNAKSLNAKGVQNAKVSKMAGVIDFTDHFLREGEENTVTFKDSKGEFDMQGWIQATKQEVIEWLSDKGYSRTYDVFASENKADINALVKIYSNSAYTNSL